jgi:SNF2 family DNA or RNA helicase
MCPNNAKYTAWGEVIEEFYPDLTYAIYDAQEQTPEERDSLIRERRDITIVNIEAIRARAIHKDDDVHKPIIDWEYANPALFDFTYEYAVLDEHHRVKTPYAQVTNGFFQIDAEDWWCPMSGTPILNRPEEIWTVLHKCYPDKFPSYETFIGALGIVLNGKIVAYKPEAMKELRDFLRDRTLRRRKDQVLKDLPEVITIHRSVVLSEEERRIYNRIEDELILEMEDGTIRNIGGALPKIIRLKQACFSPELFGGSSKSSKVEELKEVISELVASGEKAIVFSQWEKAAKILQRELTEWNPAYVTGKVKNSLRPEQQRKFMEDDDCHIYIGTIDANREAINLGIATYVIFTDEGWVPAADDQAIGRSAAGGLRGAGAAKGTKVTVIMMQAEDTYEQNSVVLMKGKKRNLFDRTVERDGGKQRDVQTKFSLADLRKSLSKKAQKKSKKKGGK